MVRSNRVEVPGLLFSEKNIYCWFPVAVSLLSTTANITRNYSMCIIVRVGLGLGYVYTLIKHNLTGSIFRCQIVLPTVLMGGSKI